MFKKIDFAEARNRICENRTDIEICEDGWKGWREKSKFFDKVIGDYFWARPDVVFKLKSAHQKRGRERSAKRRSISFEVAQNRFANRSDIELCREQYVTWDKKARFYDKIQKEYWEASPKKVFLRNSVHPKRMSQKRKETNLDKYGTVCPLQSPVVIQKSKQTCIEKWGKDHFSKTEHFRNKAIKQQTNRFITETNEMLHDWYAKQSNPKPGLTSLKQFFKNKEISLAELEEYFHNYKTHKTTLEVKAENLFEIKHFNRKPKQLKKLYRPDFKLNPTIFVNVDGLYFHSDTIQSNKWYHFNLRKEFEEVGLRLFQFREDEIRDKPLIVKSIVDNSLGKTQNKIYARKCQVNFVGQTEATELINQNHLMGSTNAMHLGLFHNNELVSLLSYKQKKHICKIERFCSLLGTNVVGGFSKLLNYLEKNCLKSEVKEIHNWVDLRYGTGDHLKTKGFALNKETLGWRWTDYKMTYNRLKCKANMDTRNLTEKRHADELGWVKIYDAGQRLYVKTLQK